jgi:putative methionine-R-sulfoxide reductase with GAF domain
MPHPHPRCRRDTPEVLGKGLDVKLTLDDAHATHEREMPAATSESVRTGLDRQTNLNWSLVVIAFLIIALGVFTVLSPIVSERIDSVWPSPEPHMILIIVLCLALLTLTGLVHQRRYITLLRKQFEQAQSEEIAHAKKHTQRLFALLNVSRVLGSSSDLQKVFDSVAEMCVDAFSCHQASLMVYDSDTRELVVRAAAGESIPSTMMGARVKLGEGIAGWAAKKGQALLIGSDFDPAKYPELELRNASLTSAMVVPIVLRDELVGVLNISTRSRKTSYDSDDLKALQVFAENVGSCIRHTEQASWLRQTIRNLQETVKAQRKQGENKMGEFIAPSGGKGLRN